MSEQEKMNTVHLNTQLYFLLCEGHNLSFEKKKKKI